MPRSFLCTAPSSISCEIIVTNYIFIPTVLAVNSTHTLTYLIYSSPTSNSALRHTVRGDWLSASTAIPQSLFVLNTISRTLQGFLGLNAPHLSIHTHLNCQSTFFWVITVRKILYCVSTQIVRITLGTVQLSFICLSPVRALFLGPI